MFESVNASNWSTNDVSVKVHFQAVGGAPRMKKKKFKIPGTQLWSAVSIISKACTQMFRKVTLNTQIDQFLRKQLQIDKGDPLVRKQLQFVCGELIFEWMLFMQFIYVRSAFCPHPNEQLGDLAQVRFTCSCVAMFHNQHILKYIASVHAAVFFAQ